MRAVDGWMRQRVKPRPSASRTRIVWLRSRVGERILRNLVYTGVTRGKRLVVLIGQRKALAIAIKGAGQNDDGRSCVSG